MVLCSKENWGEEKTTLFLILEFTSSSASTAGRAGEFSFPYMVKLGLSQHYRKTISGLSTIRVFTLYSIYLFIIFYVFREHLLVCVCVCVWCVCVCVAQLCPTLCNPMDCSLPGSSVHGIFQARVLEWVAIPFLRISSQARDRTTVSCISGGFFII